MTQKVHNAIKPRIAFLEVTSKCSLKCNHCINYKYDGQDLSLYSIQSILEKLKQSGVELIKFTGGEPFERNDFSQIILKCENLELNYIIYSNGLNLDFEWLGASTLSNLISIRVSFDGFKETHDQIRGKGNFDIIFGNLLKNVRKYPDIEFTINYTINTINYNQLTDFDHLLTKCGLPVNINIGFIKYAGRAIEESRLLFSKEQAQRAYPIIQEELRQSSHIKKFSMLSDFYLENCSSIFGCPAANESIFISRNGDVYPCGMLKGNRNFYCGNLVYDSVDSILSSSVIRQMKSLLSESSNCQRCTAYHITCTGGCRGNAYNSLLNICGEDPNCIFYNLSKAEQV